MLENTFIPFSNILNFSCKDNTKKQAYKYLAGYYDRIVALDDMIGKVIAIFNRDIGP